MIVWYYGNGGRVLVVMTVVRVAAMIRKNCLCVWLVGILDCLVLLLVLVVMVLKIP